MEFSEELADKGQKATEQWVQGPVSTGMGLTEEEGALEPASARGVRVGE